MKSSQVIISSLALGTIFSSGAAGESKQTQVAKPQQPNILFILVDDMGYGDLGALFQNQRAKANDRSEPWELSPNLDKMASEGVLLSQQYCAAPVCAPSRASLLLGVSQGHANVRDNQFDKALENNHTIASALHEIGYSTAAFGKWGLQGSDRWDENGSEWPAHPLNRGFDYFLGYMRHSDGHEHYPREGVYRGKKEVWENRTNIAAGLDKCYTADLWTAAAKRWIVQHEKGPDSEKQFFIYLAFDTPHAVLELPTQAYPRGAGLRGGMQWTGKKGEMISTASGTVDSWVHPDYAGATWDDDKDPSTPEVAWPEVYKRYATATRRVDSAVGDIMQLLKDLNIDDNTIIVFTSDNGPSRESYLPEQYRPNTPDFFNSFGPFDGIKRDCWEGGVRMPVIARWPGHIRAGEEIRSASASYDWAPTFLDAAGVPAPARLDGVSLLPSLTGKGDQQDPVVYVEYHVGGRTPAYAEFDPSHQGRKQNQMQKIRMGNFVGVRYDIQSANDDFEIYDVSKDPQEINNLARNPGMDTLQQWMKAKVLQVRRPNSTAPRPYDHENIPAVSARKTTAGIHWSAYEGDFPWVPQVVTLKPSASGTTGKPDVGVSRSNGNFAMLFEGYLNIPEDGEYTFYLTAGHGALMRIHEATLICADFGYTPGEEKQAPINLKAGLHPFRIYYLGKASEKQSLELKWSGPGIEKETVPEDAFCYAE